MNGMILWAPGQELAITEITPTLPPVGEVYVRLHSAALNKRDHWIMKGKYPGIVYPLILGSDGAGIVDEREVVINPGTNWGSNPTHFGPGFKIIGMPDNGTFAQMVKAPIQNLYDKPPHLTWTEAAALPVAGVTAYRALFTRGRANAGDKLLITGIGGGVATMALVFGVAAGMDVWVTSSSDEKIEKAIQHGAKGGVNYTQPEWEKKIESEAGEKFDIVIDGAGSDQFSKLVLLVKSAGRIVIYGGTAGMITEMSPQRIFWKQIDILGTTMGSPDDFQLMIDFVSHHKIKPVISHTFPLEEVNKALEIIASNIQFGKVCLEIL